MYDQKDDPTAPYDCPYWSGDELNKDGRSYCKLTGLDPQKYEHGFDELFECPFVRMFANNASKDGTCLVRMDLLAIESVTNLFRALFKVNLDIAHNEYFLKMDVEDSTGWWYGYEDDGKHVSFEPVVEYKFSNLHASNQVVDGKLVCTVGDSESRSIVAVNRELSNDSGSVQYNDICYCHDYIQSLEYVWERNNDSTESSLLDSTTSLIEVNFDG